MTPYSSNNISKNRFFKIKSEASWVLAGQLGIAVSTLIGVKVVTHFLTPGEYGRLALANTVVLLISSNLFGPMGQGLMRFWSISLQKQELLPFEVVSKHFVKYMLGVVAAIGFIVSIGLMAIKAEVSLILLFVVAVAVGSLTGWSGICLLIMTAARKRKMVALFNAGTSLAKPLFAAVMVALIFANAEMVMLGYATAVALSLALLLQFFKNTMKENNLKSPVTTYDEQTVKKLRNDILAFSIPFFIWGGFGWIHQSCDRWALVTYHGTDVVGAFSVLTQLAVYPLVFGSNFLSNLFLPIAYERAGSLESHASIRSANKILFLTTTLYLCGSFILISLITAFHHHLVLLISNEQYASLSHLLPGLTIAWALYYLGQTLSGFGLIVKKTMIYTPTIVTTGIIALLSTFYFASKYGPAGVVWGLGLAGLVYACWMLAISFRLVNYAQTRSRTT